MAKNNNNEHSVLTDKTLTASQKKYKMTNIRFVVSSHFSLRANLVGHKLALRKASGWSEGSEESGFPVSCRQVRLLLLSPWPPVQPLWMHPWSRTTATIYCCCSHD